jgi:hypothetical protein
MAGGFRGVSDARRDIRALAGQELTLNGRCDRLGGDDLACALDRAHQCLDTERFIFDSSRAWRLILEVQDWQQYTEMLTGWAHSVDSFETTVRRVSELPERVYFEIEERHFFSDNTHVVNSLTVFQFDTDAKICHLDVYLQQAN